MRPKIGVISNLKNGPWSSKKKKKKLNKFSDIELLLNEVNCLI